MKKIIILILLVLFVSCKEKTSGTDIDSNAPDEESVELDNEHPDEESEQFLEIVSVSAPDEYTVVAHISSNMVKENLENIQNYAVSSSKSSLALESVSFDESKNDLTFKTAKQSAGIYYVLEFIQDTETKISSDSFISADTMSFWIADFSAGWKDELLEFYRAGIGENSVFYIQKDLDSKNVEERIAEFDSVIYPVLTSKLHKAPDIDGNEKIVILLLDGKGAYGGYFNPVNQYSEKDAESWGYKSNVAEIIHIDITMLEDDYFNHVAAHEFQHLLYHARHGFSYIYWEYHDEGLAEAAIHMVYGENDMARMYYEWDYEEKLRYGMSLVHWNYADYANYAQAYLFWTYVAGQLTGDSDGFAKIFDLESGAPGEVDKFFKKELGSSFTDIHINSLLAMTVFDEEGNYSFNGLLKDGQVQINFVPSSQKSASLEQFTGAFFSINTDGFEPPAEKGENIVFRSVDSSGSVDLETPFDATGGVLLAYNSNFDYAEWKPENTGEIEISTYVPTLKNNPPACFYGRVPTWGNPPPVLPGSPQMKKWIETAKFRMEICEKTR
jgi:hypothetical protein